MAAGELQDERRDKAGSALASADATGSSDPLLDRLVESSSAEDLGAAWLALQCQMTQGCRRGVLLLGAGEAGPFSIAAVWPASDSTDLPEPVMAAAEQVLTTRGSVLQRPSSAGGQSGGGAPAALFAEPVILGGALQGAVVLELAVGPDFDFEAVRGRVRLSFGWLDSLVQRKRADSEGGGKERIEVVLGLVASALEQPRFVGAATTFVTELASELHCDRVSLGFLRRGTCRIAALSHSSRFGKRTNLIRSIEGAMDEVIDQRARVVFPQPGDIVPRAALAHAELSRQFGSPAVCTLPLARAGELVGALTLERDEPFDSATVVLLEVVAALAGPVLEGQRREDRSIVAKLADSIATWLHSLFGPRHLALKFTTAVVVSGLLFLLLATGDYRVAADVVLESAEKRAVAAPFDGYVATAPHRIGDIVKAGDLLATLDSRELVLERLRIESEHNQAVQQYRQVLGARDAAQIEIQRAAVQEARAELDWIEDRLARTELRAGIDGVVVSGDLTQQLGAPVRRGDSLFEVAPLRSYRVHLKVEESDIAEVSVGQTGELLLGSLVGESFAFTVDKITPVAVAEEGKNTFRVEAQLDDARAVLRPGLEGVGKIDVGPRNLFWIWTHNGVNWLRLKLWSWSS